MTKQTILQDYARIGINVESQSPQFISRGIYATRVTLEVQAHPKDRDLSIVDLTLDMTERGDAERVHFTGGLIRYKLTLGYKGISVLLKASQKEHSAPVDIDTYPSECYELSYHAGLETQDPYRLSGFDYSILPQGGYTYHAGDESISIVERHPNSETFRPSFIELSELEPPLVDAMLQALDTVHIVQVVKS